MKRRVLIGLMVFCILGSTMAVSAASPKVGYLWSEYNASRYNWLRQDAALELLSLFGIKCDKLSDKQASDVNVLKKYDVITATVVFQLPDDVIKAIIEYVKDGGKLVFSDGPVLINNEEFMNILGFESSSNSCEYFHNVKFIPTGKDKLGLEEIAVKEGMANCLLAGPIESAELWMTIEGPMSYPEKSQAFEKSIPGLVVNRYGKGIGVLLNWSAVVTGDIESQSLYAEMILWAAEQ